MEITLIAAQSLDGFITRHDQPGTEFTSAADRAHFPAVLAGYDASIMGGETYRISRDFIRQKLATRRRVVVTRDPARWAADHVPDRLEFTSDSPTDIVRRLRAQGHRQCALLGGSQIHSLFLDSGLVDRLLLSVEPRLFGSGTPLLHRAADPGLSLEKYERLYGSDTLLLTYRVRKT